MQCEIDNVISILKSVFFFRDERAILVLGSGFIKQWGHWGCLHAPYGLPWGSEQDSCMQVAGCIISDSPQRKEVIDVCSRESNGEFSLSLRIKPGCLVQRMLAAATLLLAREPHTHLGCCRELAAPVKANWSSCSLCQSELWKVVNQSLSQLEY